MRQVQPTAEYTSGLPWGCSTRGCRSRYLLLLVFFLRVAAFGDTAFLEAAFFVGDFLGAAFFFAVFFVAAFFVGDFLGAAFFLLAGAAFFLVDVFWVAFFLTTILHSVIS
jgi:hypothetical protein